MTESFKLKQKKARKFAEGVHIIQAKHRGDIKKQSNEVSKLFKKVNKLKR